MGNVAIAGAGGVDPLDKLPTRLSEGKSAYGGLTGRRSNSRMREKENDIGRLRASSDLRERKDFENVSTPLMTYEL